jgi:hypothetical protein
MLEDAGVVLRRVPLGRGPVFENLEAGGHRRQRWLSRSDPVPAEALPVEWRGTGGWLMVPVAGEVGADWESVAGSLGFERIGVGWQGLLRRFEGNGRVVVVEPGPSGLLRSAGLVVASVDDMAAGTTFDELRSLAPDAAIVLTAGDRGGVALRDVRMATYQAAAAPRVVDPTGAGDVFLAALMVAWILIGELATARTLRFAAAAASCAVEGVGLAGVPTRAEVAERLARGRRASPSGS